MLKAILVHPRLSLVLLMLACCLSATALAGEEWSRVTLPAANGMAGGCALESRHQSFHDGYQETVAFLRIDKQILRLVTDANIDFGGALPELHIDERAFITATGVEKETTVLFGQQVDDIIAQFIAGDRVHLQVRFWPTWPDMGLQHLEFSLRGFTRAWATLDDCN